MREGDAQVKGMWLPSFQGAPGAITKGFCPPPSWFRSFFSPGQGFQSSPWGTEGYGAPRMLGGKEQGVVLPR